MTLNFKKILFWFSIILFLSCVFFLINANPFNGDSLLAWPISESIADPSLYAGGDLIVEAGKNTNFLLYKLLSYFPFFQANFPLRDTVIYIPIFLLYISAWTLFFQRASHSTEITILSLLVFLFSDNKLGLHWSYSPLPFLVSYSSIHFIQVFALCLMFSKKYSLAFFLLGLSSFLHPATALSYVLVFYFVTLKEISLRKSLVPFASFITPFFLNYFFFLRDESVKSFTLEHFKIYEVFQSHAFVQQHFHDGYLYFFSCLGLIFSLRNFYPNEYFIFLKRIVLISLALCLAWLVNLYFIRNVTFLYFYFPMRIFYLLKPLIIFSLVWGITNYLKNLSYQRLSVFKSVLCFIFVFLMAKSFFRYHSFESSFIVLGMIALIQSKNHAFAAIFFLFFTLIAGFNGGEFIESSVWGYITLPLLIIILILFQKRRVTC